MGVVTAATTHRSLYVAATRGRAEHEATHARLRDRLDRLTLAPPARGLERGVGIDPPGL